MNELRMNTGKIIKKDLLYPELSYQIIGVLFEGNILAE